MPAAMCRSTRPQRSPWRRVCPGSPSRNGGYHQVCGPGRGIPDGVVCPIWSHHGVTRGWRPVTSDPYTRVVLATSALFRRNVLRILGQSGASGPVPMAGMAGL